MNKDKIKNFLAWMRNGISFSFTWLMLLLVGRNCLYQIDTVSTEMLVELFGLTAGGTFLFTLFFSKLFFTRMLFVPRLTGFMITFSIFECMCFYHMGFFVTDGSLVKWGGFIAILFISYGLCLISNYLYGKKHEALYTNALHKYQEGRKRSLEK